MKGTRVSVPLWRSIEHTVQFTAARVLLQRPRQGAWDLGAWSDPVWINVWKIVNRRGEPRGVYFCAVAPMDKVPAWEAIEDRTRKHATRTCEARLPCRRPGAAQAAWRRLRWSTFWRTRGRHDGWRLPRLGRGCQADGCRPGCNVGWAPSPACPPFGNNSSSQCQPQTPCRHLAALDYIAISNFMSRQRTL